MTNTETDRIQNAIRHIQTAVDVDPWAMKIAVDAMEKQIPRPPKSIKEDYNEYMDLYCPTCGHDVGMYDAETGYSYMDNESNPRMCAKCGQLLFAKLEDET